MPNSPVAPENLRGMNLINSPIWNKGSSFTPEERDAFALEGLLPPYVETLEEQTAKAYSSLRPETSNIDKHIYLRGLQDTNEVLFYRLLLDHTEELLPLIYRPMLAEACQRFADIYRRPRGLFVSFPLRDRIPELLRSRPYSEVDVIVVTDGEHVFGRGDAGVSALSVPIGKLSLYTLFGGIHPSRTLPIVLDVGTNNQELLNDPAYPGWRHERVSGKEYFDFVDDFVQAVREELPGTCLQWEDLEAANAQTILSRYGNQLPTFNDNLQGTAAVTIAALLAAFKVAGNIVRNGEVVFLGASPDVLTAADYLRRQMEEEGLSPADARKRIWLVDENGLLHDKRRDLTPEQQQHAQPHARLSSWVKDGRLDLSVVMKNIRASAVAGFSGSENVFNEGMVKEMAGRTKRPILLTSGSAGWQNSQELMQWTEGRGLVADCSSTYVFPAVGLGVAASRATRVTAGMMLAAVRALAECSPALENANAPLLPEIRDLREVSVDVATAISREAQNEGLAPRPPLEEFRQEVEDTQWRPEYPAVVQAVTV